MRVWRRATVVLCETSRLTTPLNTQIKHTPVFMRSSLLIMITSVQIIETVILFLIVELLNCMRPKIKVCVENGFPDWRACYFGIVPEWTDTCRISSNRLIGTVRLPILHVLPWSQDQPCHQLLLCRLSKYLQYRYLKSNGFFVCLFVVVVLFFVCLFVLFWFGLGFFLVCFFLFVFVFVFFTKPNWKLCEECQRMVKKNKQSLLCCR